MVCVVISCHNNKDLEMSQSCEEPAVNCNRGDDDEDEQVVEEKRKEMQTKLADRHQSRLQQMDRRRAEREESKVNKEKTDFFLLHFEDEMKRIEQLLTCENLAVDDRSATVEHFDSLTNAHLKIQKFYNDSYSYLAPYDAQKAQSKLTDLKLEIAEKQAIMLPKKKFAFKSKFKQAGSRNKENVEGQKVSVAAKLAAKAAVYEDRYELQDKRDEVIHMTGDDICKRDISLKNIINCKVFMYGAPGTVHISDSERCSIAIGPVSGSVFVDRCKDCQIATGCQQLRVHHTTGTDFYLHVTSRAIIEDTSSVRFAPYTLSYDRLDADFASAGLDKAANNWDNVDDFNWLAMSSKSPNWSVLEAENRKLDWS